MIIVWIKLKWRKTKSWETTGRLTAKRFGVQAAKKKEREVETAARARKPRDQVHRDQQVAEKMVEIGKRRMGRWRWNIKRWEAEKGGAKEKRMRRARSKPQEGYGENREIEEKKRHGAMLMRRNTKWLLDEAIRKLKRI